MVTRVTSVFSRMALGLLLLASSVKMAAPSPVVALSLAPMGVHPTSAVDFSATNVEVFVDLMKHSQEWNVEWSTAEDGKNYSTFGTEYTAANHPTWDSDGYPTGLLNESHFDSARIITVAAYIGAGGAGIPAGRYFCLFDGSGVVSVDGDAKPETPGSSLASASGRLAFKIEPKSGLVVRILRSSFDRPVRNVRVVLAQYQHRQSAFHPAFIERVSSFNTLAFHGWFGIDDNDYNTYNSAGRTWAGRVTTTQ